MKLRKNNNYGLKNNRNDDSSSSFKADSLFFSSLSTGEILHKKTLLGSVSRLQRTKEKNRPVNKYNIAPKVKAGPAVIDVSKYYFLAPYLNEQR